MSQNIATDVEKALADLPLAISTIKAAQSTLSNDQHKTVVSTALDMLGVAGQSATALAASGTVGTADAQHITDAVAAVSTASTDVSVFTEMAAAIVAGFKKAFSWL